MLPVDYTSGEVAVKYQRVKHELPYDNAKHTKLAQEPVPSTLKCVAQVPSTVVDTKNVVQNNIIGIDI